MTLKIKLNEVLNSKNKTKYWLSKQTGMTAQNIGKLANGQTTSIKFENIDAICNALECEIGDIFEINKKIKKD